MANRELTPWGRGTALSPFGGRDPFHSFRREMDRLFDEFFTPGERRTFAAEGGMPALWPSIDVEETDQAYIVTAEVPGIDTKDVEINFKDNNLTISGQKTSERKEEEPGRRYAERSFGRFERSIPFGADVDPEKVEASSKNGVLTITLSKTPQAQKTSRKIEIKPQTSA